MYVIAEIGINHNGSLQNALNMIDISKEAGCHCAKFQLFSAKKLYPKSAGTMDWKDDEKEYSYDIYEAVESFELPLEWIDELISHCKKQNIDFSASVFDTEGLNFLLEKGVHVIKLSSYTITHLPLIEAVAKAGKKTILSTGGATLAEVDEAIQTFLLHGDIKNLSLLHCSIAYPTRLNECNMGVLETFKYAYPDLALGYSDHTKEVYAAPIQAVYLGATVIEKHITLDKTMDGPDHFFALEPTQLKEMVSQIHKAKQSYLANGCTIDKTIYGNSSKICYPQERYLREFAYMYLYSKKFIAKGKTINSEDLSVLRPGKKAKGLPPKYLSLFDKHKITAKKDIAVEDPIVWEQLI